MQLKSIKYSQFEGDVKEWKLDECLFTNINLIVGKNASGKTKILNIIKGLAYLVSEARKIAYKSGNYEVHFDKNGEEITYILRYENSVVTSEKLIIESEILLDRGPEGEGEIYAQQLGQKIKFQAPENEIAAFTRRDSIQHPFFEDLYFWGKNLIHFYFATPLGQDHYIAREVGKDETKEEINLKETSKVVAIFTKGVQSYSTKFVEAIKKDMSSIGYKIKNIRTGHPTSIIVKSPTPIEGLIVEEADLNAEIDQADMSQGMFRALSLVIQINYAQLTKIPSCILIDDVGEGLDYDRSANLIKLLMKKVKSKNIQLIMTTNDRFVMNNVPLQYWSVVDRTGSKINIFNYQNAREKFEDFALTGLSNFDFFTTNYFFGDNDKE